ncbi:hypothetical protein IMG5_196610 [Ichthyophthirius multifiliis]|uniref:Vacuolar protein sorting-associated protein 54 N-terminal domain-containing protein n=1 Tax=Ichthyophthirius multifiliis TaxID=5932 RepID=G0R567_ICHMU|nr:hypothetical protein IMG5_196610 [Ichthyophthirius multifiliis]EGR27391.1 hypothetical protein IMG5_196610 [Ichthyophthirius multifiliis]|eukprot:XP_004024275.1 hypothetical protein IMG5_196610 [Ichthyophthirius multifiliis]
MIDDFKTMIYNTSLYKNIEEQSSRMFNRNQITQYKGLSKDILQKIQINSTEFDDYKFKIAPDLQVYTRNKFNKQSSQESLQLINLNQVLLDCYKDVPSIYFDSNFIFDFQCLQRDVLKVIDFQDNLTMHLDEVEINLFYQINNKFNEFLAVILNLNSMQELIANCLQKIQNIKIFNQNLKNKLTHKGIRIAQLKRRIVNVQNVLNLLQLTQILDKSMPTINSLINTNKYSIAVDLLSQSEVEYNSKFKKVTALNKFKENIFLARQRLEKNIASSFIDKSLDYVISELNFLKNPVSTLSHKNNIRSNDNSVDNSIDDSTYINQTITNETFDQQNVSQIEENNKLSQLKWQHNQFQIDQQLEESISSIVNQSYDLDKFTIRTYRVKLLEMLKSFHKGFLNDMIDLMANQNGAILKQINEENEDQIMFNQMNLDLFIKLVLFYSELLKRLQQKEGDIDDSINEFTKLNESSLRNGKKVPRIIPQTGNQYPKIIIRIRKMDSF